MSEFVHLCCLSDRSLGFGLIKPGDLVEAYAARGATAACITDYGSMSAAIQLHKCCRIHDLKPIYGMIVNLVDDKAVKKQGHLNVCLLAHNEIGFRNLVKIATVSAMYFYYVPRVDMGVLEKYSEGISALTGGTKGIAASHVFASADRDLQPMMDQLQPVFGDNLYLEVRDTPIDSQRILNETILDYASRSDCRVLATGMPHYLRPEDAGLHEALYKARNFRSSSNYPMKGSNHVKTRQEMIDSFASLHGDGWVSQFVDAMDESARLTDMIDDFDLREGVKIPKFTGPGRYVQ